MKAKEIIEQIKEVYGIRHLDLDEETKAYLISLLTKGDTKMKANNAELVIFSVSRPENKESENLENTEMVKDWFKANGIEFQQVLGSYKGIIEDSFIVSAKWQRGVEAIAREFDQESILIRHHDLSCELKELLNGKTTTIGNWTEVSEAEAKAQDGYTQELETNRFFIVRS